MSASTLKSAKKWYPDSWSDRMVRILVERGKLTKEEYKELTGKDYDTKEDTKTKTDND